MEWEEVAGLTPSPNKNAKLYSETVGILALHESYTIRQTESGRLALRVLPSTGRLASTRGTGPLTAYWHECL